MTSVSWQETHSTLHSLVDRNKVTGLKSKSDTGVTEALVVVMWEIQCTERSIILYVWCVKSHWIMWKKMMSSTHECNPRTVQTLDWQICRMLWEEWHHSDQRSHDFPCHSVDEIFLPGPRLQTDGVSKVRWRPAGGENKDHSKTYDFQSHS